MSGYQRSSVERLSIPKDVRNQFADMQTHQSPTQCGSSPSRDYLRSSREMNFTVNKHDQLASGSKLEAIKSKSPQRASEMQLKRPMIKRSPRNGFDALRKNNETANIIDKVAARRNTVDACDLKEFLN